MILGGSPPEREVVIWGYQRRRIASDLARFKIGPEDHLPEKIAVLIFQQNNFGGQIESSIIFESGLLLEFLGLIQCRHADGNPIFHKHGIIVEGFPVRVVTAKSNQNLSKTRPQGSVVQGVIYDTAGRAHPEQDGVGPAVDGHPGTVVTVKGYFGEKEVSREGCRIEAAYSLIPLRIDPVVVLIRTALLKTGIGEVALGSSDFRVQSIGKQGVRIGGPGVFKNFPGKNLNGGSKIAGRRAETSTRQGGRRLITSVGRGIDGER